MLWTLRAASLVLCISICAQAQTRTLALYLDAPRGLADESSAIMREELQRLVAPAGLEIVWKRMADRKAGENFDLVAVTSFLGSCATDKPSNSVTASTISLADTSISDGHILPFFRVDCTRLIAMLGSQVEPATLGRAIARVAAHEIYHIVAQTTEHQERGVAKATFSLRDLTSSRFDLDIWSIERMRPPSMATVSESSNAESAR
jgi:hypothetical protein